MNIKYCMLQNSIKIKIIRYLKTNKKIKYQKKMKIIKLTKILNRINKN